MYATQKARNRTRKLQEFMQQKRKRASILVSNKARNNQAKSRKAFG